MEQVVAGFEESGRRIPEPLRATILANDAEALQAFILEAPHWPSREGTIVGATLPCLILAGERDAQYHDEAQRAAAQLPTATFVSLPGLDHLPTFMRSDEVLPHVTEFLARVTAEPTAT